MFLVCSLNIAGRILLLRYVPTNLLSERAIQFVHYRKVAPAILRRVYFNMNH